MGAVPSSELLSPVCRNCDLVFSWSDDHFQGSPFYDDALQRSQYKRATDSHPSNVIHPPNI